MAKKNSNRKNSKRKKYNNTQKSNTSRKAKKRSNKNRSKVKVSRSANKRQTGGSPKVKIATGKSDQRNVDAKNKDYKNYTTQEKINYIHNKIIAIFNFYGYSAGDSASSDKNYETTTDPKKFIIYPNTTPINKYKHRDTKNIYDFINEQLQSNGLFDELTKKYSCNINYKYIGERIGNLIFELK